MLICLRSTSEFHDIMNSGGFSFLQFKMVITTSPQSNETLVMTHELVNRKQHFCDRRHMTPTLSFP